MAASSEKPKYFSGILFVNMSADDRGIHNALAVKIVLLAKFDTS